MPIDHLLMWTKQKITQLQRSLESQYRNLFALPHHQQEIVEKPNVLLVAVFFLCSTLSLKNLHDVHTRIAEMNRTKIMTLTTLKRIFFVFSHFCRLILSVPTYWFFSFFDSLLFHTECYIVSIAITNFNDAASFRKRTPSKYTREEAKKQTQNKIKYKSRPAIREWSQSVCAFGCAHFFMLLLYTVSSVLSTISKNMLR